MIEKLVKELKKIKEVEAIILFGSHAKKQAKPLSDIDIAVIVKKPSKKLETEIGSLYSKDIDIVLFHRLPLYIQFEVLKFGKPLFIRNEKFFEKIKFKVLKEYLEMSSSYERMKKLILK